MKTHAVARPLRFQKPQALLDAMALGTFLIRRQGKVLPSCLLLACAGPTGLAMASVFLNSEWMTPVMQITVALVQLPLLLISLIA